MSKTTNKFSPEVRERGVRLVLDNQGQHGSRWQAVLSISSKIGCAPQTLNDWVNKAEVNSGKRAGVSSEMAEKSEPLSAIGPRTMASALERENRELRQANEILRKASAYFAMAELDRRHRDMIAFIDDHRDKHGLSH
jgi:transposase-like protein